MTREKEAEKFVVTGTLVEDWPQGTVITREQLRRRHPDDNDQITADMHDRLRGLGVIRPLEAHEEGLSRVDLGQSAGMSPRQAMVLGQQRAEIEQLRQQIAALQDKKRFHETAAGGGTLAPLYSEDPAVTAEIERQQAELDALKAHVEATGKHLEEVASHTLKRSEEARQQAEAQAKESGQAPVTGMAPPIMPPAEASRPQPQPQPQRPQQPRRKED